MIPVMQAVDEGKEGFCLLDSVIPVEQPAGRLPWSSCDAVWHAQGCDTALARWPYNRH